VDQIATKPALLDAILAAIKRGAKPHEVEAHELAAVMHKCA
jgi:hypothetical protein